MSYILRHNPGEYGLTLGEEGYVDLTEFVMRLIKSILTLPGLKSMTLVHTISKTSVVLEVNGDKIRALHGHTAEIKHSL